MRPTVHVRFSGGPLHGKRLWVDEGSVSLGVHVNDEAAGVKRTLLYERQGPMFVFVSESETPLAAPDAA